MADYYTTASLMLPLPAAEHAEAFASWVTETIRNPPEDLRPEGFEPGDGIGFGHEIREGLWIHGDNIDTDALVLFVQLYLKQSWAPISHFGFEWAYTCSKHRLDSFGGGAAFVTKDKIEIMTTNYWLIQQRP